MHFSEKAAAIPTTHSDTVVGGRCGQRSGEKICPNPKAEGAKLLEFVTRHVSPMRTCGGSGTSYSGGVRGCNYIPCSMGAH